MRDAFPGAIIIRPSAMFGAKDGFTAAIARMLEVSPVFPLFGSGAMRLQPAFVEDVAEAAARIMAVAMPAPLYEFGGPDVLTYKTLLQIVTSRLGLRRAFLPMPFPLWRLLASVAERLPNPPLTRGQVDLMQEDNVVCGRWPGFEAAGIVPEALGTVLGGKSATG